MIFVAEIGSNHKGVKSLAYEYIRQFALAGADICKFQLGHERWLNMGPYAVKRDNWIRYAPMKWAHQLKEWCDYWDVEFMASIWSKEALALAREVGMKRYKIAHQMNDMDLFDSIMQGGKIVFVSGDRGKIEMPGRAIYVDQEYPAYKTDMPDIFVDYYGYSSHVHGIADALIAVARGAKYIEKHVTLDKTEESIKDNHFAISPQEFATMVHLGKQMEKLL